MKKIICAVLLAALLVLTLMIHGAAADKSGVQLCFIVDADSVAGCADGSSIFDEVLKAVVSSGEKTAFFFDDANVKYDRDFASALMKAFSSGMPVGVFDTKIDDGVDRLGQALLYQKYITRTSSRLILTMSAISGRFSRDHAVYTADIIVSNPDLINARTLANFKNTTMVIRISPELIRPVVSLFENIKQSGIYIITPTDAGYVSYGTED